jgi:hypothetical protein
MKSLNVIALAIYSTLLVISLPGCQQSSKEINTMKTAEVHNELGNLPKLIAIPATPVEVKWQTETAPGGNDWSLTAMLKFSESDFNKILNNSEKPETAIKAKVFKEYFYNWLPDSISKKHEEQNNSDFIFIEDAIVVRANEFIDANKSPLVHGDAVVFKKENVFFVTLYTM